MKLKTALYNTQRNPIILKRYGRNIQNIITHIHDHPDKERRSEMATQLVGLIRILMPSEKGNEENSQRIWDDLHIMSDFTMDVDSPYSIPDKEILSKKPDRMVYPQNRIHFKRYGKNVERLILETSGKESLEEREKAALYIGRLMKTFHGSWNSGGIDDSVIIKDMNYLSKNKLHVSPKKAEEKVIFERLYREHKKPRMQNDKWRDRRKSFSSGGMGRKKY